MTTPPQQQPAVPVSPVSPANPAGPPGQGVPAASPRRGSQSRDVIAREHKVNKSGLGQVGLPQPAAGSVLVGFAAPWRPVPVRLFRAEHTRVAVVGGTYVAGLLAFRTLGVGALVHVATPRPRAWRQLTSPACGGRVAVAPVGAKPQVRGSMRWPAMIINDTGPEPLDPSPAGSAWHTTVTLLPALTESGSAALYQADVVILHRCTSDEAAIACESLGLDHKHASWLASGPEDGLALVSGTSVTYVCMGVTRDEYNLFGTPVRQDHTVRAGTGHTGPIQRPGTGRTGPVQRPGTGRTGPMQVVRR